LLKITKEKKMKKLCVLTMVFLISVVAIQVQALDNLALGKPVTVNGDEGNAHLLTDGKLESDPYINGATEAMVDLEDEVNINTIKLWHYWADGRTYQNNKIAVSTSQDFAGEETVVFDTDGGDEEYAESAEGKTITFVTIRARYIKGWIGGSSVNEWSHWVELQVFFDPSIATSVKPKGKLATTWAKMKRQ